MTERCFESGTGDYNIHVSCGRGDMIELVTITLFPANVTTNCPNDSDSTFPTVWLNTCETALNATLAAIWSRCPGNNSCNYGLEYSDYHDCPGQDDLTDRLVILRIDYNCLTRKYL